MGLTKVSGFPTIKGVCSRNRRSAGRLVRMSYSRGFVSGVTVCTNLMGGRAGRMKGY